MHTIFRSLILAGIAMAISLPVFADEFVRTYSYSVNGVEVPSQHVSVDDTNFGKTVIREHSAIIESPRVETTTSYIQSSNGITETRSATIRNVEPTRVEQVMSNDIVIRELPAVVENETELTESEHSQYWPLLDYSIFRN